MRHAVAMKASMATETDTVTLPVLPPLVLQVVGLFLPPRSIACCRLVCQQWRTAFAASVGAIYVQIHLDPALTDRDIATAAATFPAAKRAVLRLPNRAYLPCNMYDSAGGAITMPSLGRGSLAAHRARNPAPPLSPNAGQAACAAAMTSLRRHLPGLRALQLGDALRPAPRPGPQAAVQRCLRLGDDGWVGSGEGADSRAWVDFGLHGCVTTVERSSAAAAAADCWGYPATLLPPEGALVWPEHKLLAVQLATELDVATAHQGELDLTPLALVTMPPPDSVGNAAAAASPPPEATVAALSDLCSLDLRCMVDIAGLLGAPVASAGTGRGGGGGGDCDLAAQLTALTVLQLRDGGQLAALRQLPRLASLDVWCCDGCAHMEMSYWTSAAPQRIARRLAPLAAALTGLTSLVLRELAARVEPPPPTAALAAALPGLRSLTLELLYGEPWLELAELAKELEDPDSETEDSEEEGEEAQDSEEDGGVKVIGRVVEGCWPQLCHSHPLDLFSCFAGDGCGGREAAAGGAAGIGADACASRAASSHGSLTHLDVTFLGAGLLPGAWHGISQLGPHLTSLALRVTRNPEEERLVASLQARTPGRWPPGSFTVPSLATLPRLCHLLLDAPLEHDLAANLTARALQTSPPPSPPRLPPPRQPLEPPPPPPPQPQPRSSAVVAPLLERLTLAGLWAEVRPPCDGSSTSGPAVLAESCPPPLSSSWASPPTPHIAVLRHLHLDGDLRHLAGSLAAGVLRHAVGVVDLRLAHRPVGHAAHESGCDGGRRESWPEMLALRWSQVPPGLESLELERYLVGDGGGGANFLEGQSGDTADAAPAAPRLTSLGRLRLRHCVAALHGLRSCPLAELAVLASWLAPAAGEVEGEAGPAADTEAGAEAPPPPPLPPWDASRQLRLLCRQPWAPRLQRLDLQLIRPPGGTAAVLAAEATRGSDGSGGGGGEGGADDSAQLPGPECTTSLSSLEHLSVRWELGALSPLPKPTLLCRPSPLLTLPPLGRLPSVGLPPAMAARWLAALPADGQLLRSLELWLGDEAQASPLTVDSCALGLLRFRSLGRLRLVLCVSADRGDAAGGGGGAAATAASPAAPAADEGGSGSGVARSDADTPGGSRGNGGVRSPSLPPWPPLRVATAWLYGEAVHLLAECLPHCQCQVVQVRVV